MKSSWVITPTTLGKVLYRQISAAIIEKSVLFNTVESMHDNITTKYVYACVFMVNDYVGHY